jgi:hypothetical protein
MASPASYQVALVFTVSSTVDITNDVEEFSTDRAFATFQRPLEVGQASVRLSNIYGRYSPDASITDLDLYIGLEVNITGVASGVSATRLFTGTIDEYTVTPDLDGPRSTILKISDLGKKLADNDIYTQCYSGTLVSSIFWEVMSSAGFSTAQRSVAAIADTRGWTALGSINGLDAMNQMLTTGPFTSLIGRDGVVAVQDRYYANSSTSVTTYSDLYGLEYALDDQSVINQVNFSFWKRNRVFTLLDMTELEDDEDSVFIPASSHMSWRMNYFVDNFGGEEVWGTSPNSKSWLANANADGSGTNRTSTTSRVAASFGTCIVASMFNGFSSGVYIWTFTHEGFPIRKRRQMSKTVDNITSQSSYGIRPIDIETDYLTSIAACSSCGSYITSVYAIPFARVRATVKNEYPFILSTDVGKSISIINSIAGIDAKFTVMRANERVTAGDEGWQHEAEYELQKSDQV